jgi:protein TonB
MSDIRADAPVGVKFSFELSQKRSASALGVSLAIHAVLIVLAMYIATRAVTQNVSSIIKDPLNTDIIWLDTPGPGGGGGGGGNQSKEPVRKAELKGEDKLTVPVVKPPSMEVKMEKPPEPNPIQNLTIPAQTLESGQLAIAGALQGVPSSDSLGTGRGSGAGTGVGSGIGSGIGSGLGEGIGGGTGGGYFRPGNGVETPRLVREVKPQYTAQAMRAKIQGTVLLECVVATDGTVGNIKVVRSLDSTFGLDQEAIKAARQWKFIPGTKQGTPVAVLVTIEIQFTLR